MPMTIAFWNRLHSRHRLSGNAAEMQGRYLSEGCVAWDLLVLCEVTGHDYRTFVDTIAPSDAVCALDLVDVEDMRHPNGVAMFARNGITFAEPQVALDDSDDSLRLRPERLLAVTATIDSTPLRVVGWHAPFAAD